MGVFHFLWNFFFGSFEWLITFIKEWFLQASESGFTPNIVSLIMLTILFLLIVGSGMAAMTIAETKNRSRPLHAVLGMFLPLVYPALLFFVLPEFKIKSKNEKDLENLIEGMGVDSAELPKSELRSVQKADKAGVDISLDKAILETEVLDQQYFARIATDENGNPTGPYMLELDDDRILSINKISAALDQVLAVEMGETEEDKKTIRLPYAKIKSCQLESEYMSNAAYEPESVNEEIIEQTEEDEGEEV